MIMWVEDLRLGRNVGCTYTKLISTNRSETNSGFEGIMLERRLERDLTYKGLESIKQPLV